MLLNLKSHLVIEFRLINRIRDILGTLQSLCDCANKLKDLLTCQPHSSESALVTASCISSKREKVLYCLITRLDTINWEIKKMAKSYCCF